MSDPAIHSTTQEFLDVYDIVNDIVLLKDGTASIILRVGTMNFSLLAEQEQDAVIFTYGSLLNSLNYPIQISIQSQTKDATKYLRLLDEQIEKTTSDRKAILIKKYRNFVAQLIKERNVLEKKFYIIVPASPSEMGLMAPSTIIPGKTAFDITTVEKSILLEKAANILEPRYDHLTAQFNRLGLFVSRLNTQEIIQNFYINYNPEAAEGQEIADSDNYTTPLVRASFGHTMLNQAIHNNPPQEQEQSTQQQQQLTQQGSPTLEPVGQVQAEDKFPPIENNPSLQYEEGLGQTVQTEVFPPEHTSILQEAIPSPTAQIDLTLDSNLLRSTDQRDSSEPTVPTETTTTVDSNENVDFSENVVPIQGNSDSEPRLIQENIPTPVNVFADQEELTKTN